MAHGCFDDLCSATRAQLQPEASSKANWPAHRIGLLCTLSEILDQELGTLCAQASMQHRASQLISAPSSLLMLSQMLGVLGRTPESLEEDTECLPSGA